MFPLVGGASFEAPPTARKGLADFGEGIIFFGEQISRYEEGKNFFREGKNNFEERKNIFGEGKNHARKAFPGSRFGAEKPKSPKKRVIFVENTIKTENFHEKALSGKKSVLFLHKILQMITSNLILVGIILLVLVE